MIATNKAWKKLPRFIQEVVSGKVFKVLDHRRSGYILLLTSEQRLDSDEFNQLVTDGTHRILNV